MIAAALLVTGCGQTVPGAPAPDEAAVAQAGDRLFDQAMTALKTYLTSAKNFRGTVFRYVEFKGHKSSGEVDISRHGDPGALISRFRATNGPGYHYDTYQPAGSESAYVSLGPGYAHLAPTKWVSMPASPPSGYVCAVPGKQTICKLSDAIEATAGKRAARVRKTASRLDDGATEVRAAVSVKAFLDATIIAIPADITSKVEPAMMDKLIPVSIVLNRDSTLRKIELIGEAPGPSGTMRIQIGYEPKGPSGPDDFPPFPAAAEVTALPDKAAADDFRVKLAQVRL